MKKISKILLVALLTCLMTVNIFAQEVTSGFVQVETKSGKTEKVEIDVTMEKDGISTSIVEKASQYVTDSGLIVDYDANKNYTTYSNGDVLGDESSTYSVSNKDKTYGAEGGSNISYESKAPTYSVDVSLVDTDDETTEYDDTVSSVSGETGILETSGEKNDAIYDFTTTSVYKQGKVLIKTTAKAVKETIYENHQPLQHIKNTVTPSNGGKEIMNPTSVVTLPKDASEVPPIKEGYEYVYLGISNLSHYWAAVNYKKPHPEIEENPIYTSEDGQKYYTQHTPHSDFFGRDLVLSGIYVDGKYIPAPAPGEGETAKSKYFPAQYDTIQQFYISDRYGNVATTYCADQTTPVEKGYSYVIKNIEDADYYNIESANMIRAISWNGYWGTESGLGSLSDLKARLVSNNVLTQEEADKLTEGIAMTATQYAIWTYSNHMDDVAFLNAFYRTTAKGYPSRGNVSTAKKEASDILFKIYEYLINLDPVTVSDKYTGNTIINENHFIDNVNVTIKDKPIANAKNKDVDASNDVYDADVSFKLAVRPRSMQDSLFVILKRGDETLASGRIAGHLQEGENYLSMNDQNEYVFENISLEEGNQELSFYISGSQYIEQGIYLYDSEIINGTKAQTMVGIASGNRNVNVRLALGFSLDVEDEVIMKENVWRDEWTKTVPPKGPETDDTSNTTGYASLLMISLLACGVLVRKSYE